MKLFRLVQTNEFGAPNIRTFTCLIDGLMKKKDLEQALSMFDEMQQTGMSPHVITFSCLINGLLKHGKLDRALELFCEMTQEGHTPNSGHFQLLD
jgi:pentatricopeptide repeat protein